MNEKEFLSLPLKQKIGQTAIVRVRDDNPEMGDEFEKYYEDYGYGALFIGSEIIRDNKKGREDIRRRCVEFRNRKGIPPLFCGDAEAGFRNIVSGENNFPDQMALGAANDKNLAYDFGKANALECLSCGVNWSFSPVADLNINPLNPIVNNRAVSDDVERALPILEDIVCGMEENGLRATIKHFPGDGVDYRDQHFVKTANTLSKEEWFNSYGRIYKRLFECGADTVMAGHICLPWYQGKDMFGDLPATLSYELLENLLRKELGFDGVIVSDALEMGAYEQEYCDREKSEIESFKAGIDMLLWPSKNYFKNLENAILSGEISEERLNQSLKRIYRLKKKSGCFEESYKKLPILSESEKDFCDKTGELCGKKGISLVRDRNGLFSDGRNFKNIVIVSESVNEKGYRSLARLKDVFEKRGCCVNYFENGVDKYWRPKLNKEIIASADLVILAFYVRPHEPLGFLDFPDKELVGVSKIVNLPTDKTVSVSFGSPYVHKLYCEKIPACINAYSDCIYSLKGFADAILGKEKFADSPVKVFVYE